MVTASLALGTVTLREFSLDIHTFTIGLVSTYCDGWMVVMMKNYNNKITSAISRLQKAVGLINRLYSVDLCAFLCTNFRG